MKKQMVDVKKWMSQSSGWKIGFATLMGFSIGDGLNKLTERFFHLDSFFINLLGGTLSICVAWWLASKIDKKRK